MRNCLHITHDHTPEDSKLAGLGRGVLGGSHTLLLPPSPASPTAAPATPLAAAPFLGTAGATGAGAGASPSLLPGDSRSGWLHSLRRAAKVGLERVGGMGWGLGD